MVSQLEPRARGGGVVSPSSKPGGEPFCGVAAAAALLGDAWTLLLLRDLAGGPRRFSALESSTGISSHVLTGRLRTLCKQGVMTRRMYAEIPPRVEYSLTDTGRSLEPVINALAAWGGAVRGGSDK